MLEKIKRILDNDDNSTTLLLSSSGNGKTESVVEIGSTLSKNNVVLHVDFEIGNLNLVKRYKRKNPSLYDCTITNSLSCLFEKNNIEHKIFTHYLQPIFTFDEFVEKINAAIYLTEATVLILDSISMLSFYQNQTYLDKLHHFFNSKNLKVILTARLPLSFSETPSMYSYKGFPFNKFDNCAIVDMRNKSCEIVSARYYNENEYIIKLENENKELKRLLQTKKNSYTDFEIADKLNITISSVYNLLESAGFVGFCSLTGEWEPTFSARDYHTKFDDCVYWHENIFQLLKLN